MQTTRLCNMALIVILSAVPCSHLFAQSEEQKLTATILHLDSAFWNAYNNCDTAHFIDFVTSDVEFYHDKGGITPDAKSLISSLNKNICGTTSSRLRREAVAGTVKVYPMQNGNEIYGAIILGEHNFYITEKDKPEIQSGVANFTQLWLLKDGVWKMARILSFNHHPPSFINTRKEIDIPSKVLDALSGTYKSQQSGTLTATRNKTILILTGGDHTYTLYPETSTLFFTKDRDLIFEFVKDASGRPIKLIVKEHGNKVDELLFQK